MNPIASLVPALAWACFLSFLRVFAAISVAGSVKTAEKTQFQYK
jgi:hypothetical protein